jgi:hypothetical protein
MECTESPAERATWRRAFCDRTGDNARQLILLLMLALLTPNLPVAIVAATTRIGLSREHL